MLSLNSQTTDNTRRIIILNFRQNSMQLIDELLLELQYMKNEKIELSLMTIESELSVPDYDEANLEIKVFQSNILENDIRKCINLDQIETAVILCDRRKSDYADYYTILLSKYLTKCNPGIHIIVELQKSENIKYLGQTKVADVICIEELSEKLLSKSSIMHGFSKFYMHLLYNTFDTNSIFSIKMPQSLEGESYRHAEELLCDYHQDMILIGYITKIEDANGNKREYIIINPEKGKPDSPNGKEYVLKSSDRLVIIAYENPNLGEMERQNRILNAA
ncbi:MAG: hypothetical protein ACLFSQ_07550 [Candidatus Zixiibacteriota bacterium]